MKQLQRIAGIFWTSAGVCAEYYGSGFFTRLFYFFDIIYSRLRYGANNSDYLEHEFYRKTHRERRRYITEHKRRRLMELFDDPTLREHVEQKHLFNRMYAPFIRRKWLSTDASTPEQIRAFIAEQGRVIVKPTGEGRAIGVQMIDASDTEAVESLIARIGAGKSIYMIEEVIENDPAVKVFNPASLNTFRVITVVDREGEVHIIYATLRMGVDDSFVDNVCAGGVMCSVNIEHGMIDSYGLTKSRRKHWSHPTSGIAFPGYRLPRWEEMLDFVRQVASYEKRLRYVGWDIAMVPDGFELIEGNCRPDGDTFQVFDQQGRLPLLMSYY